MMERHKKGKVPKKTARRAAKERKLENKKKVEAALRRDASSFEEIKLYTELPISRINEVFREFPEVYSEFKVLRRAIVDMAADNIARIVKEKDHKDHYSASKYVLMHYKSDLDETLDGKDTDSMSVSIGGAKKASPVKITFKKK